MSINIAFGIMTSVKLLKRARAVKETWGKDVSHLFFFGGCQAESSLPIISLGGNVGEGWESAFEKQFLGLRYMYIHNPDLDWYFISGCDTYVQTRNVTRMLERFDHSVDLLIGGHAGNFLPLYRDKTFPVLKFPSGGAGFFISNSMMRKFADRIDEIVSEWQSVFQKEFEAGSWNIPDVAIAYYAWKYYGIKLTEVDGFYAFPPDHYERIVEQPLTFHYISPERMVDLYNEYKQYDKKEIYQKFDQLCTTASDINEHLPVLKKYAEECSHVTEMGVRWVASTWAFLAAHPDRLISYDIVSHPNILKASETAGNAGIEFLFVQADVLRIDIEPTDLLFIDTLHTYEQLKMELILHSSKVRKYIILHDTVTFAYVGECLYDHASSLIKENTSGKGIRYAIDEFLGANPQWKIKDELQNNNGLMVLERQGK